MAFTRWLRNRQDRFPLRRSRGHGRRAGPKTRARRCATTRPYLDEGPSLHACGLRLLGVGSMFMSDVTRILSAIEQGDPHAADQLLPLVYEDLRNLAAQRLAHE